jgi:hypothetical protein
MKASTNNDELKDKCNKVKTETNGRVRKLMEDPTLEGKDENQVGRIQRKIGNAAKNVSSNGNAIL